MPWLLSTRPTILAKQAPPGVHPAVVVGLVDEGTHTGNYKGKLRNQRKLLILYELTDMYDPERPEELWIMYEEVTLSLDEKSNLRTFCEVIDGSKLPNDTDWDITQTIGAKVMLSFVKDKDFSKINGMTLPYKGIVVPEPHVKPILFMLDTHNRDSGLSFPAWIPWIFGEPLDKRVYKCHELHEPDQNTPSANGSGMPF